MKSGRRPGFGDVESQRRESNTRFADQHSFMRVTVTVIVHLHYQPFETVTHSLPLAPPTVDATASQSSDPIVRYRHCATCHSACLMDTSVGP